MTEKYITIQGSTFPDDPYRKVKVSLNKTITTEYLPVLGELDIPTGLKLLMTAMTHMEGFRMGTRAYRTNNPGNIGNTDSGQNKAINSLKDGVKLQAEFITKIAEGRHKSYPLNKRVNLSPFRSKEIWNNLKNYGVKTGDVPGYSFTYTGQLDQFVKIYATLPRISNSYINTIVSYFSLNGIEITPVTTLQEIIKITA